MPTSGRGQELRHDARRDTDVGPGGAAGTSRAGVIFPERGCYEDAGNHIDMHCVDMADGAFKRFIDWVTAPGRTRRYGKASPIRRQI